jgi:hypothetical protein
MSDSTNFYPTPYQAWKVANARIVEAGLKAIPSQMLYNYTYAKLNHNKKPLIVSNLTDGVSIADLERWVTSYIAKKTNTVVEETTSAPTTEMQSAVRG